MKKQAKPVVKAHPLELFLLAAIILGALFLRLWGIGFGLPDLNHADEPIVVNHALSYGSGDLNPHFFKIPPLTSYILFFSYGIYFLALLAAGKVQGVSDFEAMFLNDPSSFYLLGRILLGALIGSLTLIILYRWTRRFFSNVTALLACFFLSTCFLHVRDSHYIYADIPLVFLLTLCVYPLFAMLEKPERKWYWVFACLAGMCVAVKYNGVFIFVPFAITLVLRKNLNWKVLSDAFLSGLLAVLVFFVLNPYGLLDSPFFFKELFGQSGAEGFMGMTHHFVYSLAEGMGWPLLLISLLGIFASFFIVDARKTILLSFVLVYYGVLCFFSQPYDRYVLPLVPFLCFFAADFLAQLIKKFRLPVYSLVFLAVFTAMPSLGKIILSNRLFQSEDVRSLALRRLESSIPSGSKIALDVPFYMPKLKPSKQQLEEKQKEAFEREMGRSQLRRLELMIQDADKDPSPRYGLYYLSDKPEEKEGFLFSKPRLPYDLETLKREGIQYVLFSYSHPSHQKAFYQQLQKDAVLMATFSPYKDESRILPIDLLPLTGGPFLWEELISRSRNGQTVQVFKLE